MDLAVHVVSFDFPLGPPSIGTTLARIGEAAEQAGVTNLSFMDHYLQLEFMGDVESPMMEGYTSLGFLAAHTQSVELQLLVTGVTYRQPGLLGKIVATLDVLCGGRAVLGLGAAWYEREHETYGVRFPPVAERFERLEETLQIVRAMWGDDRGPFEGRHYRLSDTVCSPAPLRRPPIMIGGGGEKKTLRLVAKYADACNLFARPGDSDAVAHKLEVLQEHCEQEGTDYSRIRKTILWSADADPSTADQLVSDLAPFAELGVTEVHVMPFRRDPVAFVEGLGEHVVPALSGLR